ncbi:MAG: hypothetical protein ISS66_12165 [Desulfobacteraceae bacterium]|nr:hypothetical protein [Desulfobacteraceae bacterium]
MEAQNRPTRSSFAHLPVYQKDKSSVRGHDPLRLSFGSPVASAPLIFTMGNNDSVCGDYTAARGTVYLGSLGKIWVKAAGNPAKENYIKCLFSPSLN